MMEHINLVICSYNRAKMLKGALKSLICQKTNSKFSYDIIVIDDGSTDETPDVVSEIAKSTDVPIKYVRGAGEGIAGARNRGLRETSADWIVFFDDDQLAEGDWLAGLFDAVKKTGAICMGGVRRLYLSEKELAQLSQVSRNLLGEIDHGVELIRCQRKKFPAAGNIMLHRTIFTKVGLFNETTLRGGEDIELSSRIRKAGIDGWYTPNAVVHHVIPSYRLKNDYLLWASLRAGDNFAYRDYLEWGLAKTIFASFARTFQALLVFFPKMIWYHVIGNKREKFGSKCLIWRSIGYAYQTLHLISPKLFTMERFFARLEFRTERKIFQN